MGKLFLGSRSTLGTVILVLPADGPVHPLASRCANADGTPVPLAWGRAGGNCFALADALVDEVTGRAYYGLPRPDCPLLARLQQCEHDVWIMTEQDVLAGLEVAR